MKTGQSHGTENGSEEAHAIKVPLHPIAPGIKLRLSKNFTPHHKNAIRSSSAFSEILNEPDKSTMMKTSTPLCKL